MSEFKGVGVNPELFVVLFITILLLLGGIAIIYIGEGQEFNFYSSKLNIDGIHVQEELYYKPDKPYHTLYRGFVSEVYWKNYVNISSKNYVLFSDVRCSSGNSYIRDYHNLCYNSAGIFNCPDYTEKNEYGCTFGNTLGFSKGEEYTINSEYEIHPENLFKINNNYYIKFIVYSPGNHIKLTRDNFIVEGNLIRDEKYFPDQNVILYIPYIGETSEFNIIVQDGFDFDSKCKSILNMIFFVFFSFLPSIFFFGIWFILGKERAYEQTPKELSTFPNDRKYWEVAAYFNPPFSKVDKNFFASVLLNFYNNKIIDIKEKDKDIYIKLNKFDGDKIEKEVYDILDNIKASLKSDEDKKIIDGEYFNLKKAMKGNSSLIVYKKFVDLQERIKDDSKEYLKDNVVQIGILSSLFVVLLFVVIRFLSTIMISLYILTFLIMMILPLTGAIFSRFNGEYYIEYQKWKSFKRYLKNSFSIKTATHKTVVIWNEYLIYATALGVPEKVIKELRAYNLIDERQMDIYNGIILGSSFAFSSGTGGSGFSGGGSFGGAGGGGIGGGGGGGR